MSREAIVLDVDGTLCDVRPLRRYAWDAARWHAESIKCPPNDAIVSAAGAAHLAGHSLLVLTARRSRFRAVTVAWLSHNLPVSFDALYMRGDRDQRGDDVVKREMFDHIRAVGISVVHAYDDNPLVLAMWQAEGIPTTAVQGFS